MDIEECEEKLPKSMKKKFLKSMKKESMDKTFPKSDETLGTVVCNSIRFMHVSIQQSFFAVMSDFIIAKKTLPGWTAHA